MTPEFLPAGDGSAPGAEHTTREIAQQPALWRQVPGTIGPGVAAYVADALREPRARVVLTGAGTSAFAGQVVAPAARRTLRRRVDPVASTDLVAAPADCFVEDVTTVLVSFARSGDSPESLAAAELADQLLTDVRHLVLTCNAQGQLARRYGDTDNATVVFMPDGANDQGFAMTSSFTCMALAGLLVLAPSRDGNLATRLAGIGDAVRPGMDYGSRAVARRGYERVVYLGSGALEGQAHESALKLLELTAGRVVAMGNSPLAFRHGPKSVLDDGTLVVVYLSNDPYTRAYDLELLDELRRARGNEDVLAVTADHGDAVSGTTPWVVPDAADLPDAALALPAALFAQHLGVHSSAVHGLTADNPFPDGEVNRVVKGVRIHGFDR
jgi:tagatose-6-phosphate ketose/aldose isomerase